MSKYVTDDFTEQICWNCGHYESDSPAYRQHPELFENIARENPIHFIRKFLQLNILADEKKQPFRTDEEGTEPVNPSSVFDAQIQQH
jgi:TPP-dependent pyruvate/acetoin dehydrogenase alpha subunit